MARLNKFLLPRPQDLPQLRTPTGHPIPFATLLAVDVDNIQSEYEVHAAWLATLGYAHAVAEGEAEDAETGAKRCFARLYLQKQRELIESKAKATEKAIEAAINLDPEYQKLEDVSVAKAVQAAILKSAVRAYSDRKDMLVNLGADSRLERPRLMQSVQ